MYIKWMGAALIVAGCSGYGFSIASAVHRQERLLIQFIRLLEYMESDLQYRLTPLPELCSAAGKEVGGSLGHIFRQLSRELTRRKETDVYSCLYALLQDENTIPVRLKRHLRQLGRSLGRFDLPGQLRGLQAVRKACETDLAVQQKDRDIRLRSYQTLSLCAGAALVILLV